MARPAARPRSPSRFAGLAFGWRQRDPIAFVAGAGYEGAGIFKKTAVDMRTIENLGRAVVWLGHGGPRGRNMVHVQVTFDPPAGGDRFRPAFIPGERRDARCPAPGS